MYKWTGKKAWGYLNPSIILWFMGNLFVGINSSMTTFFLVAYFAQFYLRKYRPEFFVKYNYLVSAAMDGGTQVMVFILTFAVAGGSGKAHPMPVWVRIMIPHGLKLLLTLSSVGWRTEPCSS
jgi:hypothetical protein